MMSETRARGFNLSSAAMTASPVIFPQLMAAGALMLGIVAMLGILVAGY